MRAVPRHEFVPAAMRRYAYFDMGLPIGEGQTISSPFTVAYMTEQLQPLPTDKVLEIGTGSGYQAAVLSRLVAKVYSIEIVESLGKRAAQTLRRLGLQERRDENRRRLSGLGRTRPLRQNHRHLLAGERSQAACRATQGGRPVGGSPGRTLPADPVPVQKSQRHPQGRAFAADVLRADDGPRRGRSGSCRPNPANPILVNGDFKHVSGDQPVGWYYVRQGKVEAAGRTPDGTCLTFHNDSPGRAAQAIQAVGIDGRRTQEIDLSSVGPRAERAAGFVARATVRR